MADSLATTSAETSSESDRAVAHQQRSVTNSVRRWPTWRRLALAGICYLTLSVVIWWHVWSAPTVTPPRSTATRTLLWYLEWPAYALAHGANPFFSTAMFHPGGVNLLANTSVLGIGIPLAPLTWAFGPVLTLTWRSPSARTVGARHVLPPLRWSDGRLRPSRAACCTDSHPSS